MSTAAAADAGVPKKGKKKLIIMLAAVVLLAAAGGGGLLLMKKKAHADSEEGEGDAAAHATAKRDPKAIPTFVPLEPFTVNLADREAERYAQVGITLEVGDPHVADQIKAYMPAIRNNILMALAEKTAGQLMDRDGKAKLAEQVRLETMRAMGYEVADASPKAAPKAAQKAEADADADDDEKPKKKAKKVVEGPSAVTAVHFSNFIIQ